MGNILHDKVFDFCETYRAIHPEFLYWLRERNTDKKLERGIWFQGNENYAFVGLYNAKGGTNKTRSFGFIFKKEGDKIISSVEKFF